MNHLVFQDAPAIAIDWPTVSTFKEPGALTGYTKVSVKTPAHTDPQTGKTTQTVYKADPNGKPRYGARPFDLSTIRQEIRYVVYHHSVSHDTETTESILVKRGLSVHIGIDADGTIHQLLDLAVRDASSSAANDRGIGVEVANVVEPYGGYTWQKPPPGYDGRAIVSGLIGGVERRMFDFTEAQKQACAVLAGALCRYFPRMPPAWPKLADNSQRVAAIHGTQWGVIGHYHITGDAKTGKFDPGPAFDFPRCDREAKKAVAYEVLNQLANTVTPSDQAVQRGLQCLGYELPAFGADGSAGKETQIAIATAFGAASRSFMLQKLTERLKLLVQGA